MKKLLPFILVFTLCSCASVDTSVLSEFRNKNLEIEAEICQISESYEQIYQVKFIGNGTDAEIEVISPESISGIKAKISDGKAEFPDTVILTDGEISPLTAISHILKAWQAEPLEVGKSGENIELKFNDITSVFSAEKPIYSEIICDNKVVLRVDFIKSEVK